MFKLCNIIWHKLLNLGRFCHIASDNEYDLSFIYRCHFLILIPCLKVSRGLYLSATLNPDSSAYKIADFLLSESIPSNIRPAKNWSFSESNCSFQCYPLLISFHLPECLFLSLLIQQQEPSHVTITTIKLFPMALSYVLIYSMKLMQFCSNYSYKLIHHCSFLWIHSPTPPTFTIWTFPSPSFQITAN